MKSSKLSQVFSKLEISDPAEDLHPRKSQLNDPFSSYKKFSCYHSDRIHDFTFVPYPDGKTRIITCSDDETLGIFNEDECEKIIEYTTKVYAVHFYREQNVLISSDYNGDILLWTLFPEIKIIEKIGSFGEFKHLHKFTQISKTEIVFCDHYNGSLYQIQHNEKNGYKVEEISYPPLHENHKKESLRCIYQLQSQPKVILFSGGNYKGSGGEDYSIKKIDMKTKDFYRFPIKHTNRVNCLCSFMNEKNKEIIISGSRDETIIKWSITSITIECLEKIQLEGYVDCCIYDRFRKKILFTGGGRNDKSLFTFCMKTSKFEKHVEQIHTSEINSMKWIDEEKGTKFLTCSNDESFNIYEFENPIEPLPPIEEEIEGEDQEEEKKIRFKKLSSPFKNMKNFSAHKYEILDCTIIPYPDGKNRIVTCSDDKTLKIFNKEKCEKIIESKEEEIFSVHYFKEQNVLITLKPSYFQVWSVPGFEMMKKIKSPNKKTFYNLIQISENEFLCSEYDGYRISKITFQNGNNYEFEEIDWRWMDNRSVGEKILCISQSRSKNLIFFAGGRDSNFGGKDFHIRSFHLKNKMLSKFPQKHSNQVNCLISFINEKNVEILLSGGSDQKIMLWKLIGDFIKEIIVSNSVKCFLYDDVRKCVWIGVDEDISLFSIKSSEVEKIEEKVHEESIICMNWFDNEEKTKFITCSEDTTFNLFELEPIQKEPVEEKKPLPAVEEEIEGEEEEENQYMVIPEEEIEIKFKKLSSPFESMKNFSVHLGIVSDCTIIPYPDGKNRIVTCSYDKTVKIFFEEKCEKIIKYEKSVYCVHYFKEQNVLLTLDEEYFQVYKLSSEMKIIMKKKVEFKVWNLIQVSNTEFVCSSRRGNRLMKITFQNNNNNYEFKEIEWPLRDKNKLEEKILCVYQSKSQKNLIFFAGGNYEGNDFSVRSYDSKNKIFSKFPLKHTREVSCLSSFFNEKNEEILLSLAMFKIMFWNLNGDFIQEIVPRKSAIGFLYDDLRKCVWFCGYKEIYAFNIKTFEMEKDFVVHESSIICMNWYDEEKTKLITCSHDKSFNILQLEKVEEIEEEEEEEEEIETEIEIEIEIEQPNILTEEKIEIKFKKLSSPFKNMKNFSAHKKYINDCTIIPYPDGKNRIVTSSYDETIKIFNEEKCERVIEYKDMIFSVHYFKEQNVLITLDWDFFKVWSLLPEMKLIIKKKLEYKVRKLIQISSTEFLCAGCEGNKLMKITFQNNNNNYKFKEIDWHLKDKNKLEERIRIIYQSKSQKNLIFFAGGDYEGKDFSVRSYDLKNKIFSKFPLKHTNQVESLISFFNEKNEEILLSRATSKIMLWTLSGDFIKEIVPRKSAYCFLYDDVRKCVWFSGYNEIYAFNIKTFEMDKGFHVHKSSIICMDWYDEEKTKLITCSQDYSFNILQLEKVEEEEVKKKEIEPPIEEVYFEKNEEKEIGEIKGDEELVQKQLYEELEKELEEEKKKSKILEEKTGQMEIEMVKMKKKLEEFEEEKKKWLKKSKELEKIAEDIFSSLSLVKKDIVEE